MTMTSDETGLLPADASDAGGLSVFEVGESAVRSYGRSFPVVFASARDEWLVAGDGRRYLDFLAGAGSLNYGHNPRVLKDGLLAYVAGDGLTHGLDLATAAKGEFLTALREEVLAPRGLAYRVQFTSPSGTNAVEAALKLARLVTGRTNVVAFSGGFHGVSTGALAATAGASYKAGLWATFPTVTHVPFPVGPLGSFDSLDLLERMIADPSAGMERPAAVLVETVQGEGGVWVAPVEFLRGLRAWCDRHQVVLIVDDVQAGCGRTGAFFSFERAGIVPDLVVLSKSIGGYGLPMAVLLIRPELDVWRPGQHNGTFRGNQLAFVAGAAAIRHYWAGPAGAAFTAEIAAKAELVATHLAPLPDRFGVACRGLGLLWGIDLAGTGIDAGKVSRACFERHLIVEVCGRGDTVLKLLPPLTITPDNLHHGLTTLTEAIAEVAHGRNGGANGGVDGGVDAVPAPREA